MAWIRQYILSITAAAIICGILVSLFGKKGTIGTICSMLCGIFLAIVVIRPITTIELDSFSSWMSGLEAGSADAAAEGESLAWESLSQIIKEETEAYILDKAASLGLSVEVSVRLDGEELPVPESVTIQGTASAYQRLRLTQALEEELNIAKEDQLWIDG